MRRARIEVLNRNRVYRYGFYRRTDTSSLMKINPAIVSPDFFLEPVIVQNSIVDTAAEGNGIATPSFKISELGEFIEITAEENKGVTYYYGIVAFRTNQPVSKMEIVPVSLKQKEEEIWNILQSTDEVEKARFKNKITLLSSALAESTVPQIQEQDIRYDLSNIIISNEVIINLPNVWYDINRIYNYRQYFPINILAVSGQQKSKPHLLFDGTDKAYVPIHKIEILKSDVTEYLNTAPDTPEDPGVEVERVIVFKEGIYYLKDHAKLPLNMINKYSPVSVFDSNSRETILSVRDKVLLGKKYKYTFRLFDCEERMSEPTVLIITT